LALPPFDVHTESGLPPVAISIVIEAEHFPSQPPH
jgi:hypothetical protein